jgi:hypothetical protein
MKVRADFAPSVDFTTLHTWDWSPKGAGNAARIISSSDNSGQQTALFQSRIVPIVQAEFERQHFAKAPTAEADFYVTCFVLVTVGDASQTMGQFVSPVPDWGLPPFVPSTSSLEVFPRGSLILDIAPRALGEVAWRGVAETELDWDESMADREKRVRTAVRQLLAKFPPKPAKKK